VIHSVLAPWPSNSAIGNTGLELTTWHTLGRRFPDAITGVIVPRDGWREWKPKWETPGGLGLLGGFGFRDDRPINSVLVTIYQRVCGYQPGRLARSR